MSNIILQLFCLRRIKFSFFAAVTTAVRGRPNFNSSSCFVNLFDDSFFPSEWCDHLRLIGAFEEK